MGRWWWGLLLALVLGTASARLSEVREQVEASMLVTGQVMIEADGHVSAVELDQRDRLPVAAIELLERSATGWRFEPILGDGQPRAARTRMSVRLVAKRAGEDDTYLLSVVGAHFGGDAVPGEASGADSVRAGTLRPPVYPQSAMALGAKGTVYVVVRVGRDGKVSDAFAEQVNLRVVGSERSMQEMRDVLARSALRATRQWTFIPPTEGEGADEEFWMLRVPVDYALDGEAPPAYGEWSAYVPGPRADPPAWRVFESLDGFDIPPDALVAGGIYQVGKGRRLLTPLDGS